MVVTEFQIVSFILYVSSLLNITRHLIIIRHYIYERTAFTKTIHFL